MAKPKSVWRCDEVLVSLVLREYDASGKPLNEQVVNVKTGEGQTAPIKVYRAQSENFWALMDQTTKRFIDAQERK